MSKISIGRFDTLDEFEFIGTTDKTRIRSNNPNLVGFREFTPIASDGFKVIYNGGTYLTNEFSFIVKKKNLTNLMVLTNKEKMLLMENGNDFAYHLHVLEHNFPIFNNIKFSGHLESNIKSLSCCLRRIKQLGISGCSLGHHVVTEGLYRTERKIRWKNSLDANFFFANFGGYQEVFKLKEEREERIIIALDYNSMYASCMSGAFLEPKNLSYQRFDCEFMQESTPAGFYRVKLINPINEFIKKYHPFKFTKLNRSYSFNLKDQDEITLLLFTDEIEYYQKHFEKVYIIDGITSSKTIEHPLKNLATKLYNKRIKAKAENNQTLDSYIKLKLALLHSSTNKRKEKISTFANFSDLSDFLKKEFHLARPSDVSRDEFIHIIGDSKSFSIEFYNDTVRLTYPSRNNAEQIFSLTARVLANARLKMTKTLEFLMAFNELELCYVNIDSIHISIPKHTKESFLNYAKDIISDELGKLKIQCCSDKGYWLDVGRYWLVEDDRKVSKYANIGFNFFGNSHPFVSQRKKLVRYHNHDFDFCKSHYINIESSFSFKKKLLMENNCSQNYERYDFHEISTLSQMMKSEQKEVSNSLQKKASTFHHLKRILHNVAGK